jgi:Protein of unknown function (DUF1579).
MTNQTAGATDWLDRMLGEWTLEGRSVPDDPAQERTGVESVVRLGAWIVVEGEDYRFQLASDPATGRVTGDFVHWQHPQLWTYDGAVEADGALHLHSRGPDMAGAGGETDYVDVFEIVSADERRSIGRVRGQDGSWRDFSRTSYRRRAG